MIDCPRCHVAVTSSHACPVPIVPLVDAREIAHTPPPIVVRGTYPTANAPPRHVLHECATVPEAPATCPVCRTRLLPPTPYRERCGKRRACCFDCAVTCADVGEG